METINQDNQLYLVAILDNLNTVINIIESNPDNLNNNFYQKDSNLYSLVSIQIPSEQFLERGIFEETFSRKNQNLLLVSISPNLITGNFVKIKEDKSNVIYCNYFNFTKNLPEHGYTYDISLNSFIPPKPEDTYILNTETLEWEPDPTIEYDLHGDGKLYLYDSENKLWMPTWEPEEFE